MNQINATRSEIPLSDDFAYGEMLRGIGHFGASLVLGFMATVSMIIGLGEEFELFKSLNDGVFSRILKFILALFVLCYVLSFNATAAVVTWDGEAKVDDWSGGGPNGNQNWVGDKAPVEYDSLVFAGTSRLTPNNNTSAGRNYAGLTFSATAGAYILGGNSMILGGAITNSSTNLQTINLELGLNATQTLATTSGNIASNGVISGAGGIFKTGINTLILSGDNNYAGSTTVGSGTLLVNNRSGSATGTGSVTVQAGATLGGSGTVGGATTIAGNLNPGNSAGEITFGNSLNLQNTATTFMEIDGAQYDRVNVGTSLTYGGGLVLNYATVFESNQTINLFDFASQSGSFSSVTLAGAYSGSLVNDGSGVWALTSGDNSWTFTQSTGDLNLTVIPEPGAALLGGLGVLLIMLRRRRF